jgi:hypothetical protein
MEVLHHHLNKQEVDSTPPYSVLGVHHHDYVWPMGKLMDQHRVIELHLPLMRSIMADHPLLMGFLHREGQAPCLVRAI